MAREPSAGRQIADTKADGVVWGMPAVKIEDQPRFPWRGLMLDPARFFLAKDFIKRYIDLLLHALLRLGFSAAEQHIVFRCQFLQPTSSPPGGHGIALNGFVRLLSLRALVNQGQQ